MKKKVLLSSVLSIVLCLSLICGATFALFTDTDQVNIAVTAGNVDIEVTVDKIEVKSYDTDWSNVEPYNFSNGGAVVFADDSNQLSINKITPGDAVRFDLVVTNKSNVDIKFFTKLALVEGLELFQGMEYTISTKDGEITAEEEFSGITRVTEWVELAGLTEEDAEAEVARITVEIELPYKTAAEDPENLQSLLMGESTKLCYTVQAVQANADPADMEAVKNGTTHIYTPIDLQLFAANVNNGVDYKGETVQLMNDIDLEGINWTPISGFAGTFDGAKQAAVSEDTPTTFSLRSTEATEETTTTPATLPECYTIENLTVNTTDAAGLFAHTTGRIQNVNFNNAKITGTYCVGVVAGKTYSSITNCTVTNSTVTCNPVMGENGVYDDGNNVGGIVGFVEQSTTNATNGVTYCSVSNTTITGYRDVASIVGSIYGYEGSTTGVVQVTNCVVDETVEVKLSSAVPYVEGKARNTGNICAIVKVGSANIAENEGYATVQYLDEEGITYTTNGEAVTLYLVPADYEGTTVTVLEGVTNIGSYAFAYNDNIETIVLSSTVTTLNDRAFRDTSASTVILNEGLTNISYQAFRNASNVKSVVIPSTVTTISKEAFQNSGIETLTVPATVTTIEYGAMRDMMELVSVVIEGNVYIPTYAFRACTLLQSVVLLGDDVTFQSGGMIFTNKENGDGSAITVCVANDTVKERLLAADTAAKSYGGYTIVVGTAAEAGYIVDANGTAYSYDADTFVAALEDGKDVVLMTDTNIDPAVMSNAYGKTGINVKNGQTIDGNGAILDIQGAGGTWDSGINTTGGIIKNITVTGSFRGIFINHNSDYSEPVILENVIIDGTVYTISCDQGTYQTLKATNSTFNGWTSYAATLGSAEFINCSFGEGSGYAFCRPYAPTTFVNCAFEAGYEMDPRAEVTFVNCTLDGVLITADNFTDLVTSSRTYNVKFPAEAGSAEDLSTALGTGEYVVMTDDVKTTEILKVNGSTLDGNGNTIDTQNVNNGANCAITTTGGTVKNVTITGDKDATRALGSGSTGDYSLTEDLYIDNVYIDNVQYGINGSGKTGSEKVIVTNSTVCGWNSFANIELFSFENCTLGKGNCPDGYFVVYGATSFTNCKFEGVFDMGARKENGAVCAAGETITFTNCTYDGVQVTAENFVEYFYYGAGDEADFGNLMRECTIIVDGVQVDASAYK